MKKKDFCLGVAVGGVATCLVMKKLNMKKISCMFDDMIDEAKNFIN